MTVESALAERHSARAFTAQKPDGQWVKSLLEQAGQSASAGNLQPWKVIALTGAPLQEVIAAVQASEAEDTPATASYPPSLWEPYRSRRFENGEDLYATLGIAREDKEGRLAQLAKNFEFFGAPFGLFVIVDERMLPAQWLDLGIYLQSLMLLATEQGLATCAQGFWRRYQSPLKQTLQLAEGEMVAFGVSLGYEDKEARINQWRSKRASTHEWLQTRGF